MIKSLVIQIGITQQALKLDKGTGDTGPYRFTKSSTLMEKNMAILMADLSGYTAMTDVHGGASAAMLVKKYMAMVDQAITGSTKLIQRVGDQIVLLAEKPDDILATAIALNKLIHNENHFLSIHAGVHYGSVFIEDGNLFGSTINIASRIMNMAEQGEILCSSQLFERVDLHGHSFKHLGEFSFKNALYLTSVYELKIERADLLSIDPVCRMQVDPVKESYSYRYQGKEYHFCGKRCWSIFHDQPVVFGDNS